MLRRRPDARVGSADGDASEAARRPSADLCRLRASSAADFSGVSTALEPTLSAPSRSTAALDAKMPSSCIFFAFFANCFSRANSFSVRKLGVAISPCVCVCVCAYVTVTVYVFVRVCVSV